MVAFALYCLYYNIHKQHYSTNKRKKPREKATLCSFMKKNQHFSCLKIYNANRKKSTQTASKKNS